MISLFSDILNISLTSSILILAIIFIRATIKKAPKFYFCILWALAGLRLIIPFSFENAYSPVPSYTTVNQAFCDISTSQGYFLDIGKILAYVWIAGIAIMGIYGLISYISIKHKIAPSIKLRGKVYICDGIESPFILGVFSPKIYIPSELDSAHIDDVLRHEKAHLSRGDHLWKPLGYLILTLHWFNPIVWVAYILLCRDIEKACDEKVISKMGSAAKMGYLESLVVCSVHRKRLEMCPVAFGEIGVRARVKLILAYKRPSLKLLALCLIAGIFTVGFLFTSSNNVYYDLYTENTESIDHTKKQIDYEKLQKISALNSGSSSTTTQKTPKTAPAYTTATNTNTAVAYTSSSTSQNSVINANAFLQRKSSSLLNPTDPSNSGPLAHINRVNEMNARNRQSTLNSPHNQTFIIFP